MEEVDDVLSEVESALKVGGGVRMMPSATHFCSLPPSCHHSIVNRRRIGCMSITHTHKYV